MKKNQKGFMLLETLVVSTFVISTLVYLYVQFVNLKKNYDISFKYDTIPGLYSLKEVDKFINNTNSYKSLIRNVIASKYTEIYNNNTCNNTYFSSNISYCNDLMSKLNIKTLIFTDIDLENAKDTLNQTNPYSNDLYLYIKSINYNKEEDNYLLIAEFKDGTFANVKLYNSMDMSFGGTLQLESSGSTKTYKGIVYLNPKNLKTICTESNSQIGTGAANASGCMKFYIFDNSGSKYKMILDHNTTALVAWANRADYIEAGGTATDWDDNSKYNTKGPVTAIKQLTADTTGWIGNPRIITADEIAKITGANSNNTIKWAQGKTYSNSPTDLDNQIAWFYFDGSGTTYSNSNGWQKQNATSKGASNYAWLYDYTSGCESYGCDTASSSSISGYWTSNVLNGTSRSCWAIISKGFLGTNNCSIDYGYGIRPVIEISKTAIE